MLLKKLSRAFAALALLFAPAVHAQAVRDADPALWVVRDDDTTIYLFGTFHALKPGLTWFDEAIRWAFDRSDEVMLEMVKPDAATLQGLVLRMASNPSGPTLTESIPENKRSAYIAAMSQVGVPAAAFDRMDPWLPAVILTSASMPSLGYDPAAGAEEVITAAAAAAGKRVGGLETAEQQLGYFDNLPRPLQIRFLTDTVDELPRMGESLDKMLALWSAGDADGLGTLLNEELTDTPELARVLLTERNARWAEWIAARMDKPGTVFVAVGAGHLAGGNSVQAFLRQHGLTPIRILY